MRDAPKEMVDIVAPEEMVNVDVCCYCTDEYDRQSTIDNDSVTLVNGGWWMITGIEDNTVGNEMNDCHCRHCLMMVFVVFAPQLSCMFQNFQPVCHARPVKNRFQSLED